MVKWLGGVALALLAMGVAACGEDREAALDDVRGVLADLDPGSIDAGSVAVVGLPTGDTLHVRASVLELYRGRGYEPAWTDRGGLLPGGRSLVELVGGSDAEGLEPERYRHSTALELIRRVEAGDAGERGRHYLGALDLLLTEVFARLARDLHGGMVTSAEADPSWRIEADDLPERELLEAVFLGDDAGALLASLRPRARYYHRLVGALETYRAAERRGGWPGVAGGGTLRAGDRDARVGQLRERLMAGADAEEARLAARGGGDPTRFDADLERSVERFQKRHDLHEDGALGPNTLAALNVPIEDRIEALRLSLDRWRWLPQDLGEMFLLVNVAGFELELVSGDSAVESMNVVVGRTARRTPLFQDTLEYMVVNPYWNVPLSIAREEIIPAFLRDPHYLERNNYEVLRNGRPVSPRSTSLAALYDGRYAIRQRPGPGNALGNVKFVFPNDMDIYLHDTPAPHLFSQTTRAFSYGCIRVERPDDLARTLLSLLTDRDPSLYDRLRARPGEQWLEFDRKIPIYIVYFTAWVDADGTARFHQDIYDRDGALEDRIRKRLGPEPPGPIGGIAANR